MRSPSVEKTHSSAPLYCPRHCTHNTCNTHHGVAAMKSLSCPSVCLLLLLAEAHAVVKGEKQKEVKEALTRGVKIIVDAQNKDGGWRYRPDPRDADLSVTTCQLHALFAAMKAGATVPEETLDKGIRYVRACH